MAHNGGILQGGLNFADPYFDPWAINMCKLQINAWVGANTSDTLWTGFINTNGYPTQMPTGVGSYWQSSQLWIYGNPGDTWDLVYPSQHTLVLDDIGGAMTLTETDSTAGHKRYQISGTLPWGTDSDGSALPCGLVSLRINAMSGSDWTGGISLHRTDHQTLVDAGEIFNPDFLARLGSETVGVGKIRFMDCIN